MARRKSNFNASVLAGFENGPVANPERYCDRQPSQTSQAQTEANRQNAWLSTGPRTQEGKNRSRLNTTTHGFTSQGVVLAALEIPSYKAHLVAFLAEHKPKTPTETFLVETIAEIAWTVSKIRAQEQNFLSIVGQTGFNRFEGTDPEMNVLMAQATHSHDNAKYVDLLSRYEQRKMRTMRDALRDLKQMQAERKLTQQPPVPAQAIASPITKTVAELIDEKPANGFVCSEPSKPIAAATSQAATHPPHPVSAS